MRYAAPGVTGLDAVSLQPAAGAQGELAALKEAAGPENAGKLDRAPTLVAVSVVQSGDPVQDEEDLLAAGCAVYAVLLGAHARVVTTYALPGTQRHRLGLVSLGGLRSLVACS